VFAAVFYQIGDGDYLDAVLVCQHEQGGQARHAAILVHDLAEDTGRGQPCQAGKVHRGFGVTSAHQHSALAGDEGEEVTGAGKIAGLGVLVYEQFDGLGAVVGGDAGGGAGDGVHGHGEGGAHQAGVFAGDGTEFQRRCPLAGEGDADKPPAIFSHKVDGVGVGVDSGDDEVALVFAVGVIHHDKEATGFQVLYGLGDGGELFFHAISLY
jgi:hypothetical protein